MHVYTRVCVHACACVRESALCSQSPHVHTHRCHQAGQNLLVQGGDGSKVKAASSWRGGGGDRVAVILPSSPPHLGVRGSDSPAGNLSVHPSIRSGQNRAWPCDGAPSCLSGAWEV